ncbi:MAG: hypothetical protein KBE65_16135 [Phycisphaerae bacterium]|nr:hypothetical protein [Phycisphaerae bacterium]
MLNEVKHPACERNVLWSLRGHIQLLGQIPSPAAQDDGVGVRIYVGDKRANEYQAEKPVATRRIRS